MVDLIRPPWPWRIVNALRRWVEDRRVDTHTAQRAQVLAQFEALDAPKVVSIAERRKSA